MVNGIIIIAVRLCECSENESSFSMKGGKLA